MSRTKVKIRGKEYAKGKQTERPRIPKDAPKSKLKKHFGHTSGTHSNFEPTAEKNYPVKNEDFIKYGYGNGTKKEKKTKHYKKEIE